MSGFRWEHTLFVNFYSWPRGPRVTDSAELAFKWFRLARAWTSNQLLFSYLSQSQLGSTHWQAGMKGGNTLPQWDLGPTLRGKVPMKSWAQEGTQYCQTHSCCFLPHWQHCSQPAMSVLRLQRKWDFHSSLTWNFGRWAELDASCCISNLLESKTVWETHCSLLSLLPWRRLTFPASCKFPFPGSWKSYSSWRSPIGSATFLLQVEAGKHTTTCYLFVPEGGLLFPHPRISCARLLEKRFWVLLSFLFLFNFFHLFLLVGG